MTVDHASVIEKKAKLLEAINVLKKLRQKALVEIEEDEITAGAMQYYLMMSIEVILDIGSHILTEDCNVSPESYEDVIRHLAKQKVITQELAQQSQGMGKFRNKMIHEYSDVDMKKVYAYLQQAPDQFAAFNQAFSEYLKSPHHPASAQIIRNIGF